ncbi:unnamed protein product [Periconia digitata]|uniref:Uncharacterized protein n=1 Tax=Periconia digitata TaxID=1303443 RepID=A0A9W4U5Y0_9PLEO|nr:unnamed protein product [Periconia digitata]
MVLNILWLQLSLNQSFSPSASVWPPVPITLLISPYSPLQKLTQISLRTCLFVFYKRVDTF